jgi:hypothetical protein
VELGWLGLGRVGTQGPVVAGEYGNRPGSALRIPA